jgi:drug/metabolite transporter (DMT)-like permease
VTLAALALVTAAAVLHSAWNALAKRGRDPVAFLWLASCCATVALAPAAAVVLVETGVTARAIPFVVATIALHGLYFYALGRAYAAGAYSLVYPISRGLGVALVPPVALVLFDEHLSALGVAGIALVLAGIVALHLVPGPGGAAARRRPGSGTWWAVLTGLTIVGYVLVDRAGVRHLNPVPYMLFLMAGSVAVLGPVVGARREAVRREWADNRAAVVLVGVMSAAGYMLVLFGFRLSKTGYVVAARELAIVFSAVIGSLWLAEGRLGPRLLGAGVVLAGVVCVALAR